ncbi:MAG: TIR domain-containing protein [Alphaproteobacteria bacterium]|nr:TIR domain-containing protein [Alphaproteobacteria bacterium]
MDDQPDSLVRPPEARDVFVSHSSKDREIAKRIVEALKAAKISTYFSTEDQRPSTVGYHEEIRLQLSQCCLVLGIQSRNALRSDYTKAEWRRGHKKGKLLFARIDSFDSDELDLIFDKYHFARLMDWDGAPDDQELRNLVDVIRDEVERRRPPPETSKDATRAAQSAADVKERAERDKEAFQLSSSADVRSHADSKDANPIGPAPVTTKATPTVRSAEDETPLTPPDPPLALTLAPRDWSVLNLAPLLDKALQSVSIAQIRRAARSGQSDAQALIGFAHLIGAADVSHDEAAAGRWLEKAAPASPRAKAELSWLVATKRVEGDRARADRLSAEAAATDCARAKTLRALLRHAGRIPSISFQSAARLLEEAAGAGDTLAGMHFGWSLLNGIGVRRNGARAHEVMRNAAQAGDAGAMARLGVMYAFGRGVPRDSAKGAHWFRQAAKLGDSWGLFYFGMINEVGFGVARDAIEARKWYEKAARLGDKDAQFRLARMLIDGRGGVADLPRAAELLQRAADGDSEEAAALLGQLYEQGRGVPRNLAKAVELYESAAEDDEALALWRLAHLYENGQGVARDRDRAIAYYRRAAFNAPDKEFFAQMLRRLRDLGAPLRLSSRN